MALVNYGAGISTVANVNFIVVPVKGMRSYGTADVKFHLLSAVYTGVWSASHSTAALHQGRISQYLFGRMLSVPQWRY